MASTINIRRALISVYDKTGIVDFARALHDEFGVEIISTGGTARTLTDAGIPVTLVEDVTGFPEMMDGRVKTLHPKVHAGILADRDNPEHMRQLAEQGIEPIDMVVVNLYPFEKTVADPNCTFEQAIEMIDIGGPCLLRAAAKNHRHVLCVIHPQSYEVIISRFRSAGPVVTDRDSFGASISVFGTTRTYDLHILGYLFSRFTTDEVAGTQLSRDWVEPLTLRRAATVRYAENPHQTGEVLRGPEQEARRDLTATRPHRTNKSEMSFNNYADASAALELCAELTRANRSAKLRFAFDAQCSAKHRFAPVRDEQRSRRNLPHWRVPAATYWVTYASRVGALTPAERDIAMAALRFWDGRRLDLHAAVVMPDHVHALLTPRAIPGEHEAFENLSELLKSIKSYSGREIAKARGQGGVAWVHESYDHWLRSPEEFREKWQYLAENVVKEGLADTPAAYDWWYAVDLFDLGIGEPVASDTVIPPILGGEVRVSNLNAAETTPAGAADSLGQSADTPEAGNGEHCATTTTDVIAQRGDGKAELCTTLPVVCFIKHTNACGTAVDPDPVEAYRRAYLGDPNAAMGGILAVNFNVTAEFATAVMETYQRWGKTLKEVGEAFAPGAFFVEVWIAPSFDADAVEIIRGKKEGAPKKPWGERVRLLEVGDMSVEPDPHEMDLKRIAGGVLMQTRDLVGLNEDQWKVVTERKPTDREMDDLRLAWLVCKHTKSNAITICKDGMLIGNGAGQMSRVMSCRIATWLAKENGHGEELAGSAAASDAFFPFRDGPDILADAGVTAIIQPGGSKRDDDTIAACDERGIAMVFTGTRHFKH